MEIIKKSNAMQALPFLFYFPSFFYFTTDAVNPL